MPSYDIIPLASDLLDYTIQRVKQKEAEYKPVKAYIMVGDQLVEKLLYDKVKDDGKPHFPKSQTFHLCAELQDCAVRILKGCEAANGRYFETEYEERLKDLDGVLIECQTMEQLINLSYGRKYITGDQCHYWAELVRPVRQKAFNWRKSDGNRATANYEVHLLANIVNLVYILQTKIYRPGLFRVFYVYEPKKRLVQAPAFVDKVVQHALVDNLIYERITNSFILDNYASQKGKGLHFGLDRLRGFFTEYWNKYRTAEGRVLKADVRHFFASIDHDKLKEKLKKLDLEPIVFDLLCTYIDSTDGLPLGYQTSQLFALLFLDEFDHFVKERLRIRWYGRYMDDFFLIHPDKDYLQFCLKEIRVFMASLGLELNEKTQIFPIRNGIDFLGFHTYLTEEGKVIRKLRHSSIKRMRSKLRRWEQDYPAGLVTREKILQSWQAWDAHAAHGNTWSLRQQVRDRVQNILKEEI